MTYIFNVLIQVKEKSKRLKIQVIAMALLIIAIIIEMIYSQYYMLVLLAPLFYLLISFYNLKRHLIYLQNSQLTITFSANYAIVSIIPPGNDWKGRYLINYENFCKIEIDDNGRAEFVFNNVLDEQTNRVIKRKILKLKFVDSDACDFKNAFEKHVNLYKKNNDY